MSPKRLVTALLAVFVIGATQGMATAEQTDDAGLAVFAGTGVKGSSGDGGPASAALLNNPTGVAVASDGTVYISDSGNHTVRAVTPDGVISTVVGTGRDNPEVDSVPDGTRGTEVDLVMPGNLAVGADGTLYIADAGRNQVLALSRDGGLSVVAGSGIGGRPGEGGPATKASLARPIGLTVDPHGTLYIGEFESSRVRTVSLDGVIATVAGNGGGQFTAAGGVATEIPVGYPTSLAADGHGTVWIASGLLLLRLTGGKLATVTSPNLIADGKWGISEAATWPPPEQPLGEVTAVAVGPEGVYVLNQRDRTVLRLGAGNMLEAVATIPRTRIPGPLIGPIAFGQSGVGYLVDVTDNRIYSFRPAAPQVVDSGSGSPSRSWLYLFAGAVVVLAVGSWQITRRRRMRGTH